jgi:Mn2+/Fe2+ NRAMP family transporter
LRNSTTIIALTLGIFFFVFFFLMILHAFGFVFNLNVMWDNPETYTKITKLFPWFGVALIITLVIIMIVSYLRKT